MRILIIVSFLMLCFACQSLEQQAKPSNLISPDKLRAILIDIHIKDAHISEQRYPVMDSAKADYKRIEEEIFKKYGVNTKQYRASYEYYAENQINQLHEIYTQVVDSLSYREKVAKSQAPEKKITDVAKIDGNAKVGTPIIDTSRKLLKKQEIKENSRKYRNRKKFRDSRD